MASGFGWPPATWDCEPDELEALLADMREAHRQAWLDYPEVWAFLKDHFPGANIVKGCRTAYDVAAPQGSERSIRVILRGCDLVPWCPACLDRHNRANAGRLMGDIMGRYTPHGAPVRFLSGAFSCRLSARLEGWGMTARERVADLKDTVRRFLLDAIGEGYGASLAYHDIGESGFAKPNPHVDVIVNGYALRGRGVEEVDHLDYTHGGKARYGRMWMEHIKRTFPLADEREWDFRLTPNADADTNPWTTIRYHVRELADLRKLQYDAHRQVVSWESEREQFTNSELPVARFLAELRSYFRRTGGPKGTVLRSRVGHFSQGAKRDVTARFGRREPRHPSSCTCIRCNGLERRPGGLVGWTRDDREMFS